MRKILSALAVLALASAARAMFPGTAQASSGGYWAHVCCGTTCGAIGDYCTGSGGYTCCKG